MVNVITDLLILTTALWGQYWRTRAKRFEEVIQYMVEEEIGNSDRS